MHFWYQIKRHNAIKGIFAKKSMIVHILENLSAITTADKLVVIIYLA